MRRQLLKPVHIGEGARQQHAAGLRRMEQE